MTRVVRRVVPLVLLSLVVAATRVGGAETSPSATPSLKVPSAKELIGQLKQGHPRLLVDAKWFDELPKQIAADPALKAWDQQLVQQADRLLKEPMPRHVLPDGKRLLSTSRAVMDHVYTLAVAYRLHGDRRHRERLWQEVNTVAAFPDFNPRHFLDTAEMTHALAIAYDWLFDTWTEKQRATFRRAIVEMGLKPGLKVYRSERGWPRSVHNWNQVCNGGMTLGALAVGDEEPELAGQILHHAIQSLPVAMASYAPDGAWCEGPGYWSYATTYNVLMLAALRSALGSEFGLAELPGFSQTGLFPIYMTSPIGRTFNFSDSGAELSYPACLFWLARRFDLPVCNWFAARSERAPARGLVWYQRPTVDAVQAGLPTDKYFRHVEVMTMRSAWNDPQALFVGMQAGSNRVGHNHLDLGSFVLDALGQRWAMDLGGDNYNLPDYFGSKRYTYYRLRAEGHNTLVLNPDQNPDQDPKADARIARFQSGAKQSIAIADLTPAYANHATRVERGVAMLQRRAVLVQDELQAPKPVALWWFMHTPANVSLSDDGRSATLEQQGKKLIARLLAPAEAKFTIRPAAPLPTSPNPEGQRANTGVQKLSVELPQAQDVRLTVLFLPLGKETDAKWTPEVRPLAQWQATDK